ncbi:MAG TPA: dihydropteroate synthase, partial [Thermoplasmatales archaeon]|nr:dihydropteroate synthase [Thermoplasmatales archaeon]
MVKELRIGNKRFQLGKRTIIMGILNVTPDSFSDGGRFLSLDKAVEHAVQMEKDGADIIDIGGESTRPGASPVSVEVEMNRVVPVIEQLIEKLDVPLSIDTYKSVVARKALDLGVGMVNDITAFRGDPGLADVVKDYDVPICLMHMKGNPRDMQ